MITVPFQPDTFRQQMKPLVSMAHLSLEYENIESSVVKTATSLSERLGADTYEQIAACAITPPAGKGAGTKELALDMLRRAILHFALYEHVIYTIANMTNDGITVTKSDDKTTIYKYQQDQLEEKLLQDAWFWLNRLISLLNDHTDIFTAWAESKERLQMLALPVTLADFERCVGVSDPAFLLFAGWIVREVWREEVLSRFVHERLVDELTDAEGCTLTLKNHLACGVLLEVVEGYRDYMKRLQCIDMTERDVRTITDTAVQAVCYDTMARACRRLAYHALPSPIRIDINNEMGKNHAAQADTMVREQVARLFADKAAAYWHTVDQQLKRYEQALAMSYPDPKPITEKQKFAL